MLPRAYMASLLPIHCFASFTLLNKCSCRLGGQLHTWMWGSAPSLFLSNNRPPWPTAQPAKTIELKNSLSVPHHATGLISGRNSPFYQGSSEDHDGPNVSVSGRVVGSWRHHTTSYISGTLAFSSYTSLCPTPEMSGCHLVQESSLCLLPSGSISLVCSKIISKESTGNVTARTVEQYLMEKPSLSI